MCHAYRLSPFNKVNAQFLKKGVFSWDLPTSLSLFHMVSFWNGSHDNSSMVPFWPSRWYSYLIYTYNKLRPNGERLFKRICKSMQNSLQLHFNTLKLFRSLANLKSWKPVANKQNVNGTTFFNVGPPKEDILFDHLL